MAKIVLVTGAVQRKYLADPNHCPFCDSENIVADHLDPTEYDMAYRNVNCLNPKCRMSWTEQFKLTGIMNAVKK